MGNLIYSSSTFEMAYDTRNQPLNITGNKVIDKHTQQTPMGVVGMNQTAYCSIIRTV
jgi:hypothetical protein